jgi:hypothetical protein
MILTISQKNIKIKNKNYFIFYLQKNKIILEKIGYLIILDKKMIIVKINLNKLFYYFYFYKALLFIKEKVYIKFFILYYFFTNKFKVPHNPYSVYLNSKNTYFVKKNIFKNKAFLSEINYLLIK